MNDHNLYAEEGFFGMRPSVGALRQKFVVNPYSTWNTREGDWLKRRRLWLDKGIKSEEGRNIKTYDVPKQIGGKRAHSNTNKQSVFDPVVCELAYTWWCKPGGVVLDPFAGGSVRGIVASILGLKYYGIELRKEQVKSNREQINENTSGRYKPKWRAGDSFDLVPTAPECDFLFSCPPYGNLEVYSDDPNDISNMRYCEFLRRYNEIIKRSVGRKLKENRFACFVVGNYRSKEKGIQMVDLVGDTVRAFEDAGANLYNDIVLINSMGSAAVRASRYFHNGARKVVKLHQNVLVFVKGDPKIAAKEMESDIG